MERHRNRRVLRGVFGKPTAFAGLALIVTVVVLKLRVDEQALPEVPRAWLAGLETVEFCTVGGSRAYSVDGGPRVPAKDLGFGFIDGYPVVDVRTMTDSDFVRGSNKPSDTKSFGWLPDYGLREFANSEDYILISLERLQLRWSVDGESGSIAIVRPSQLEDLSREMGMETLVPPPY